MRCIRYIILDIFHSKWKIINLKTRRKIQENTNSCFQLSNIFESFIHVYTYIYIYAWNVNFSFPFSFQTRRNSLLRGGNSSLDILQRKIHDRKIVYQFAGCPAFTPGEIGRNFPLYYYEILEYGDICCVPGKLKIRAS